MNKSSIVERGADVVLVAIAMTMFGVFVFGGRGATGSGPVPKVPNDWKKETHTGIKMGADDAKIVIVEFMDFQCPYCALWASRVDSLVQIHPTKVQVVFHHYPLASHPFAVTAAIAAECADRQGVFAPFQRALFEKQKLIGTKKWEDFAVESGVPNLKEFSKCATLPADSFPRIAYGRNLGQQNRVRGTPTVWLNGKIQQPTFQQLSEMAR